MAGRGTSGKALRSDRGVRLYASTPAKPRYRAVAHDGSQRPGRPLDVTLGQNAAAPTDPMWIEEKAWADEYFDRAVKFAKGVGYSDPSQRRARIVGDLIDERERQLNEAVDRGERERRTFEKAESLHRLHVRPILQAVPLLEWDGDHCRTVLQAKVGDARRTDIGAAMRALVTLAHKQRWLPDDRDPMEDIEYWAKARVAGEAASTVPAKYRPSTDQVKALAEAMGERCRAVQAHFAGRPNVPVVVDRAWGELICNVGSFSGLRVGERFALTAESVLGHDRPQQLHLFHTIEGSDSGELRYKGLKGRQERYTVVAEDVWPALVARAEALLARFGPEQGPYALLFPARDHVMAKVRLADEEAARRGVPVGSVGWRDLEVWNRSEFTRSIFKKAAAVAGWPSHLTFNHLRHHFAGWFFPRSGNPPDISLVSMCMGHQSPQVTWNTYFRTTEAAIGEAAQGLRT